MNRRPPAPIHAVVTSLDDRARGHEATRVCACRPELAYGMQVPGLRVYVHRGDVRLEMAEHRPSAEDDHR